MLTMLLNHIYNHIHINDSMIVGSSIDVIVVLTNVVLKIIKINNIQSDKNFTYHSLVIKLLFVSQKLQNISCLRKMSDYYYYYYIYIIFFERGDVMELERFSSKTTFLWLQCLVIKLLFVSQKLQNINCLRKMSDYYYYLYFYFLLKEVVWWSSNGFLQNHVFMTSV